jgi:hypothetical protein
MSKNNNQQGLTIERQSSDFALGDGGRQESVLEPGFVRAPRDMKPPTPVEWGRGDSLMWDTSRPGDIDKSTPLAGYGRDKDLFADAVSAISPNQPGPAQAGGAVDPYGVFPAAQRDGSPAGQAKAQHDAGASFAAVLSGRAQQQHQPPAAVMPSEAMEPSGGRRGGPSQPHQHHQGGGAPPRAVQFPHHDHHHHDGGSSNNNNNNEPSTLQRQRTSEADLAAQFRTQSQVLTDELHQQAKTFPPPPPIIAPAEQRRYRAARWYYYATKWDITHEQAPPPRSPLPLLDQENEARSQGVSSREAPYPYRGEYWLQRCEHWFGHIQSHFSYPGYGSRTAVTNVDPQVVLQHAYLGDA